MTKRALTPAEARYLLAITRGDVNLEDKCIDCGRRYGKHYVDDKCKAPMRQWQASSAHHDYYGRRGAGG